MHSISRENKAAMYAEMYGYRGTFHESLKYKKIRRFYHTFTFKEREVTIMVQTYSSGIASVTYAVKMPQDKEIEGLTKKILHGREITGKHLVVVKLDTVLTDSIPVLKGIAIHVENELNKGNLVIKGIR